MAFPGTYNINYYKGDTFEFRVYPKDSLGGAFPLAQFVSPNGVTRFTIAPQRGSGTGLIQGYAQIADDNTNILCVITPANGAVMTAGTNYEYDVEIARSSADYDYVYTLLTGTVSVSEQVTQPGELQLPNNPTGLTLVGVSSNSISVSWTAPAEGGEPDEYKLYVLPYTTDPSTILAGLSGTPQDTVDASITQYTFTGLDAATGYLVGVRSSNAVGDADIATILSNLLVGPIPTLPEVS